MALTNTVPVMAAVPEAVPRKTALHGDRGLHKPYTTGRHSDLTKSTYIQETFKKQNRHFACPGFLCLYFRTCLCGKTIPPDGKMFNHSSSHKFDKRLHFHLQGNHKYTSELFFLWRSPTRRLGSWRSQVMSLGGKPASLHRSTSDVLQLMEVKDKSSLL